VLPLVLGALSVEAVSTHAFASQEDADRMSVRAAIAETQRLVEAVGADLGAVFDNSAERLYLVDEQGREISTEQTLLLYLRLLGSDGRRGKLAFPITVTSHVDQLVSGSDLEIVRTPASLGELTKAASQEGVVFAGAVNGGYVFPEFIPAYDATASLCKLLELLAPLDGPVSSVVSELPQPTLVHEQIHCPWSLKGLVMRVLTERLKGRELDLLDGIKLFDARGWSQVLPDPDEPVVHLYAEGRTPPESAALAAELRELVENVLASDEARALS
jgi:mannose-1-phosphate guanylyltransferase/phosphomannomutase